MSVLRVEGRRPFCMHGCRPLPGALHPLLWALRAAQPRWERGCAQSRQKIEALSDTLLFHFEWWKTQQWFWEAC